MDYEVTEGIGKPGVVSLLRNGKDPVVVLRDDLDVLPIREQAGVDYTRKVLNYIRWKQSPGHALIRDSPNIN